MIALGSIIAPARSPRAGKVDFPILSMTMHNGLVDQADKFKKRVASEDTSAYKIVSRGQLVVGFPIDEGVLSFQKLYEQAIVSPAYTVWDISVPDVDKNYLEKFLRSPIALKFYTGKLRSTTARRRSIPQDTFLELPVPLPPLAEQKRIAAILDKAEQLRQKRRQATALLDRLTQSIFLEMFGDPVSNPKGWPLQRFGALVKNCDSIRVPVKQSDRDNRSGPYPYYGSVGIIDNIDGFLFEGEHLLISEDGKHLQSRTRPIACIANGKFWVNNHAHVVKSNGRSDLVFLRSFLELSSIDKYISGIDQIKLTRKSMDKITVPIPPIKLQEKYRNFIESLEIQEEKMHRMEEQLIDVFASLQHRAFSGQL